MVFSVLIPIHRLRKKEFKQILVQPENAITKQYEALLQVDGVNLIFKDEALDKIAEITEEVDKLKTDNEELLKVNGRLFQKIGFDEDIKDESAELPSEEKEEEITVEDVIDEKGELI